MKKLLLIGAALTLAPTLAFAADLSGAWKLAVKVGDMDVPVTCNLTQSGTALGGTCGRSDGTEKPGAVTGTVTGDTAAFSYSVSYQDMPLKLDYAVTSISPAAIGGTISVAGQSGTFTGAK